MPNRDILVFFFIMSLLISVGMTQKAIVFSSSVGFYNYRQTANALKIYHHLKQYGFSDQDIILMIPENTGCSEKNPRFGQLTFYDNQYQPNLNQNIEIDFDFTTINMQRAFDILRCKFPLTQLEKSKFTLPLRPQPLFIYITGHGGNTYFKIRERQALLNENFAQLFQDISRSKVFSKVLLMSDSCSAITPFETVEAENFTAFASSSFDEMSKSHGYDIELNSPKSDDFTFYFDEYLNNHDPRQEKIELKDLFRYMSFQRLGVHAKVVGKGRKFNGPVNDFIVKRKQIQTRKFRL